MKHAINYLQEVSKPDEILDFEQMFSVDLSDAEEAVRIAYNQGLEDALLKVSDWCDNLGLDKRDIALKIKKLKQ